MKRIRGWTLVSGLLGVMTMASTARAEFTISFSGPTTIVAGNSAIYDVLIHTDGNVTDNLTSFTANFSLSAGAGHADFATLALEPMGYVTSAPYIFSSPGQASTFAAAAGTSLISANGHTASAQDTSAGTPIVPEATHYLLAKIAINVSLDANQGEIYTLSLDNTSRFKTSFHPTGSAFTSNSLEFSTRAVPEPASMALVSIGGVVMAGFARSRRKLTADVLA